jgi:apolipoprotein N-acyltransferase
VKSLLLAITTGILLALSLPPHDYEWLAWVALVPLFLGARKQRLLEAVGLGMISGITAGAVLITWTQGTHGLEYATFPFLLLALMLGVMAPAAMTARESLAGSAAQPGQGRGVGSGPSSSHRLPLPPYSTTPLLHHSLASPWFWCALVAACGIVVEWLTTFAPIPLHLALTQHAALPLIQIASITGIWGVSFLIWLTNAAVVDALLSRSVTTPGLRLAAAGIALAFLAPALLPAGRSPATVRAAAIQDYGGVEGATYARNGETPAEGGDREELTRRAVGDGARLIVWPELGLGASFNPTSPDDETTSLARELQAHLVVGYSETGVPKGFNCAAIIDSQGRVRGVHRKNYPFLGERKDTQPGRLAQAYDTDLGRLGIAICFDTCYAELPRRLVRDGARLIAMPNYDPVTPRGLVHDLHGAVLPFRAIENRVPIIRADSNGSSQIIDPDGKVLGEAPLFRPALVVHDVRLGTGEGTFFTRAGDWLVYGCMALLAVFGVLGSRQRATSPHPQPADPQHRDLEGPGSE